MEAIRYRGRWITAPEIDAIRALMATHPQANRAQLAVELCKAWRWVQPNGVPSAALARGLFLALHRSGHIELPPPVHVRITPPWRRRVPVEVPVDETAIEASLSDVRPLEFRRVRRTADEPLFNWLIHRYHYLGYTQPVGAHLKYLVLSQGRVLACLAWGSAPRHLGARDRHIGWAAEQRTRNLRYLAYNPRYLILPWVKVVHLASHILGQMARRLPSDWQTAYGHPVYYLETFVDANRYRGTCYRAANWQVLGVTTGRGKNAQTKRARFPIKQVLGYPLVPDFRQRLRALS